MTAEVEKNALFAAKLRDGTDNINRAVPEPGIH